MLLVSFLLEHPSPPFGEIFPEDAFRYGGLAAGSFSNGLQSHVQIDFLLPPESLCTWLVLINYIRGPRLSVPFRFSQLKLAG